MLQTIIELLISSTSLEKLKMEPLILNSFTENNQRALTNCIDETVYYTTAHCNHRAGISTASIKTGNNNRRQDLRAVVCDIRKFYASDHLCFQSS